MDPYFIFVLEVKGPIPTRTFRFYNPVTCKLQWTRDHRLICRAPFTWFSAVLNGDRVLHYSVLEQMPFKSAGFDGKRYVVDDVVHTPPRGVHMLPPNQVYCARVGRVAVHKFVSARDVFHSMPNGSFEVQLILMPWEEKVRETTSQEYTVRRRRGRGSSGRPER